MRRYLARGADAAWHGATLGRRAVRPARRSTSDGTVLDANAHLAGWLGRDAAESWARCGCRRSWPSAARIYWETHLSPLLHVERRFDEVALELRRARGPAAGRGQCRGAPRRAGSATRRRLQLRGSGSRYERELQAARVAAERSAGQVPRCSTATAALSDALGVDGVAPALLDRRAGPLGAVAATLWLAGPDGDLGATAGASVATDPPRVRCRRRGRQRAAEVSGRPRRRSAAGQIRPAGRPVPGSARPTPAPTRSTWRCSPPWASRPVWRSTAPQLYEHSASVAHELQHSLLAIDPPDDPRFAVATSYRPGVEMLEVGGDWYDVFLAERGHALGRRGGRRRPRPRGSERDGPLRSAVRAVAGPEAGPGTLLHGWTASSSRSGGRRWRPWPTPSWTWRPARSAMPAPGTRRRC